MYGKSLLGGADANPLIRGVLTTVGRGEPQGFIVCLHSTSGTENIDFILGVKLRKAVNCDDWDDVVRLFTDNRIPFSAKISSTGNTALHASAIAGRAKIVKELVENLSVENLKIKEDGWTALMAAALTGITPMAECMVEKNREVVGIENNKGLSPVIVASAKDHRGMVHYLNTLHRKS